MITYVLIHMFDFNCSFIFFKVRVIIIEIATIIDFITMRQYIFLLLVCYSTVHASPLNLFVNSTTDDRPDLEIIDGDIAFIAGTAPELAAPRNAYIRSAKWVSGVLPYVISTAFTAVQRQTIINSMRKIEEQTGNCIRFVARTNQASYINILNGKG